MARDHRIVDANGLRLDFTCENRAYVTNVEKGFPHGASASVRGSVFDGPLILGATHSLWIEHVLEKGTSRECYWLMWYDQQGMPTIPLSAVFDRADLEQMAGRLARFVP
jgi:hypothetical protein